MNVDLSYKNCENCGTTRPVNSKEKVSLREDRKENCENRGTWNKMNEGPVTNRNIIVRSCSRALGCGGLWHIVPQVATIGENTGSRMLSAIEVFVVEVLVDAVVVH